MTWKRRVRVYIDEWDTHSANTTLSYIILPIGTTITVCVPKPPVVLETVSLAVDS